MTTRKLIRATTLAVTIPLLLAGCGSDSDSTQSASLTLSASDAPVDSASEVVIYFDQIELNGPGEENRIFAVCEDLDEDNVCEDGEPPLSANLLDYQGSAVFTLLQNVEVPSGDYQWMRVRILNGDGTENRSYVRKEINGETVPLVANRKNDNANNSDTGEIQLDGFTLATGDNHFVVEFDLRRSLVDPQSGDTINLKPRGVRLSNEVEVGHLAGDVSAELRAACETLNQAAGDYSHVVYLYSGDIGLAEMDDDADTAETGRELPLATAAVVFDDTSESYEYEFGFVAEGTYSLGYSCVAQNDLPESNETSEDGFVLHSAYGPVTVTAGSTSEQDLGIPAL